MRSRGVCLPPTHFPLQAAVQTVHTYDPFRPGFPSHLILMLSEVLTLPVLWLWNGMPWGPSLPAGLPEYVWVELLFIFSLFIFVFSRTPVSLLIFPCDVGLSVLISQVSWHVGIIILCQLYVCSQFTACLFTFFMVSFDGLNFILILLNPAVFSS